MAPTPSEPASSAFGRMLFPRRRALRFPSARYDGPREEGGYPRGFFQRPIEKRNAWFCAFILGFVERQRALTELADY